MPRARFQLGRVNSHPDESRNVDYAESLISGMSHSYTAANAEAAASAKAAFCSAKSRDGWSGHHVAHVAVTHVKAGLVEDGDSGRPPLM